MNTTALPIPPAINHFLTVVFTISVDQVNEQFYFDRRDNELYSVFITDFLLLEEEDLELGEVTSDAQLPSPYTKAQLAVLLNRIQREGKGDSDILPLPRLSVIQRQQWMQAFVDQEMAGDERTLYQPLVAVENGRTKLNFEEQLPTQLAERWKVFKKDLLTKHMRNFCTANHMDLATVTLWSEQKTGNEPPAQAELPGTTHNEQPAKETAQPGKPWWKLW